MAEPIDLLSSISDDQLKASEGLKKFEGKPVDDIVKSYLELEKYRGNSISLPSADAKDEDYAKIYDKLGRPKTADEYALDKIEGLPEGQGVDPAVEKQIKSMFHEAGLNTKQANRIYGKYIKEVVLPAIKQKAEAEKATRAKAEGELRSTWGVDFDKNRQIALDGALKFADEADKEFIRENLSNDPRFIRLFNKIGASFQEDKAAKNLNTEQNKQSAMDKINEIKADPKHPYWNVMDARHETAKAEFDKLNEIAYAG